MITKTRTAKQTPPADKLPSLRDFPSFTSAAARHDELRNEIVSIDARLHELRTQLVETPETRELHAKIRQSQDELAAVENEQTAFARRYHAAGNNESRRTNEATPAQRAMGPERKKLAERRLHAEQTIRLSRDRLAGLLNAKRPSLEALRIIDPTRAQEIESAETEVAALSSRRKGLAEAADLQREIVEAARRAAFRQITVELRPKQATFVQDVADALESLLAAANNLAVFNARAAEAGAVLDGVNIPQLDVLRNTAPGWLANQRSLGRIT